MRYFGLFVAVLSVAGSLAAAPGTEGVRRRTLEYVQSGNYEQGAEELAARVCAIADSRNSFSSNELEVLAMARHCARLLELMPDLRLRPDVAEWVLESDERLYELAMLVSGHDDKEAFGLIVARLYDDDPKGRDEWFRLIYALAAVWDTPERPPLHYQMGNKPLDYDSPVFNRYQYFKTLYSSGEAALDYDRLSVQDLLFVVDTPVPVEELEWARDHIDGSANSWKKYYSEIEYDQYRLRNSEFQWPHGDYRLADILELGGICVDQAYFATLTARANGIPAAMFSGRGSGGSHAWFSYMRSPGKWNLDVGRYESQDYTTGTAKHPQTNEELTDHDIEYLGERGLASDKYREAEQYGVVAEMVLEHGTPEAAARLAEEARRLVPRFELPWDVEAQALVRQGELKDAIGLLDRKADLFRKYDDIYVRTVKEQIALMRRAGRQEEADKLMKQTLARMRDSRDDLARMLVLEQTRQDEEPAEAMNRLESLIRKQKDGGFKNIGMLEEYVKLARRAGQSEDAARFADDYVRKLMKDHDYNAAYKIYLLKIVRKAYENAGDQRELEKVEEELAGLQESLDSE